MAPPNGRLFTTSIVNLSDYEKNLFLIDLTLKKIQSSLNKYKNSLLIVTSDHWFKEGHTEDKDKELQQIKRFDQLSDDDKLKLAKIQAMMDRERSLREDDLNEDRRRVVDYDNRDDRTTELFLDNGDSVEVDVIELYDNLKENNPED